MAQLPEHAIVMHPGPMNRGVEIAAEVADSARSTIVEQVANGVSVRMAVLYLLLGGAAEGPHRRRDAASELADHRGAPARSAAQPGRHAGSATALIAAMGPARPGARPAPRCSTPPG